ncbi:AsmA family protein [Aquisphaera giovannonii]|uniref:AsmA family protein n=1 Tax=Aquisphaera giovannonii TaxID=406548 RepID=A0A5B9VYR9_9BACT|nr:AsmA-like C-terminal region-containing protein [Aquisphaera giovannonii]QEH33091.1 AsmA family protein [Aquisphaera giovannonii]
MKRRRLCWLGRLSILGLGLSPGLLWVLIVLVAPTNWARRHVIAALEASSGRAVELDSLGVCLGGNVSLSGLRIASPSSRDRPWLDARQVQLDVSLIQLLRGRFDPTSLDVEDATLRVLRRRDGSLEIADSSREARAPANDQAGRASCAPARLAAKLHNLRLEVVDEPDSSVLALEDVSGDGLWEREGGLSTSLFGRWNQGTFQLTAHLGCERSRPVFEGELRASDVLLDERMGLLSFAVPVLAGSKTPVQGKLALDVYMRGGGASGPEIARSLVGHGHLAIDPVNLTGTPFMAELRKVAQGTVVDEAASLRSDFTIQSSRITTERMELAAGRLPIVFSGWTDFTGALDYTITVDGLADRVPEKARRLFQRLDVDLKGLTTIKLAGNLDRISIRMNTADGSSRPLEQLIDPDDRARLRMLSRQFRNKVVK